MKKEFPYAQFQEEFGQMYHLVLYRPSIKEVRFVSFFERDKGYTTLGGHPIFMDESGTLCLAHDYTILFPKIYIKKAVQISPMPKKVFDRQQRTAFFH